MDFGEEVRLFVPLHVGTLGDRGPAFWSFSFVLPATCYSLFSLSATAQAPGKDFLGNADREIDPIEGFIAPVLGAGMSIIGQTEITDSAKVRFVSAGARTP